jgi:hypothetical protein
MSCLWVGKGRYKGLDYLSGIAGVKTITPEWPSTREELTSLLKRTRVLYTCDDQSLLNLEALLCGCTVIQLPDGRELKLAHIDVAPEAYEDWQLENFIKVTKNGQVTRRGCTMLFTGGSCFTLVFTFFFLYVVIRSWREDERL